MAVITPRLLLSLMQIEIYKQAVGYEGMTREIKQALLKQLIAIPGGHREVVLPGGNIVSPLENETFLTSVAWVFDGMDKVYKLNNQPRLKEGQICEVTLEQVAIASMKVGCSCMI
jgi:hypothetical protein